MWVDNFTQIGAKNAEPCILSNWSLFRDLCPQYTEREVVLKNTNSIQSMKLPDWKNEGEIIV
jgi:hypothetical protein